MSESLEGSLDSRKKDAAVMLSKWVNERKGNPRAQDISPQLDELLATLVAGNRPKVDIPALQRDLKLFVQDSLLEEATRRRKADQQGGLVVDEEATAEATERRKQKENGLLAAIEQLG